MTVYSDYDPFASIYNKYWGDDFTPRVFPILEQMVLRQLPTGARILDLCCGTGQLAGTLTALGYRVTGIDGSPEMLKFARGNAPDAEFINADARTFKLPQQYEAVFSVFDSLNHVMSLEELTDVFRNVYAVLREGGYFFFDMNMVTVSPGTITSVSSRMTICALSVPAMTLMIRWRGSIPPSCSWKTAGSEET